VPCFIASRKASPVEMCGIPNCSTMCSACVPFPAPGGPMKTIFMKLYLPFPVTLSMRNDVSIIRSSDLCDNYVFLLQTEKVILTFLIYQALLINKPFVVAFDQLALDLLHRFQTNGC